MRFYFDVADGRRITDPRGQNCRTLEDAKSLADQLAAEWARKLPKPNGEYIAVVDAGGQELYRAPMNNSKPEDA
jgi:hypothetical protein